MRTLSMREQGGVSKQLAVVLGGGGSRGALQVGALRALLEYGYMPDLLVGTSAGAINAAFLAIHGSSLECIDGLEAAWHQAARVDLLPSNYVWTALRSMLRPSRENPANRIREFLVESGVAPDLLFLDLKGPRLIVVSSDLTTGTPVLHGLIPTDPILDALLVSTALPPWVLPVRQEGHYLMDGAVVSALPIQPALQCGATEIIAVDLTDPRETFGQAKGFGVILNSLTYAVEQRQVDLELDLARARGVPVLHLRLNSAEAVPVWDFGRTGELIAEGYELTKSALHEAHPAWPVPPISAPTVVQRTKHGPD